MTNTTFRSPLFATQYNEVEARVGDTDVSTELDLAHLTVNTACGPPQSYTNDDATQKLYYCDDRGTTGKYVSLQTLADPGKHLAISEVSIYVSGLSQGKDSTCT